MKRVTPTLILLFTIPSLHAIGQVVPTITSLSPESGFPLQSLTIGGSGMSLTPSDHKVFVGGVRAPVSSSGEGSVTVSVPYGAQYGSVQVSTLVGKTTLSGQQFIPTFFGGDFNSSSFATRQTISHETDIRGMNVGDLDGDGKPDLIVGNYEGIGNFSDWYLSIYPNTSSGSTISFGSVVQIPSLAGISKVYTADMNGDGKLDVVTVNELEASLAISIFRNTSTGSGNFSFTRVTDFATNFTVNSVTFKVEDIAIGDLDKDGYLDIGAIYNLQYFRIILNSESGTWSTPYQESDIGEPVGIEFVDLNSDGKLDIAIPNAFSDSTWRMYINNSTVGSIALSKSANYPGGNNLGKVYKGDFDKDGRVDLLIADASLFVHRKTTTAFVFDSPVTLTSGEADYVAMGDVDGDTKPDLVISNSDNTVRVFRNQSTSGSISFAAGVDFAAGGGIQKPRLVDLNADGKPEIVLNHVTSEDNTISILQNVIPTYSLSQTSVEVTNDTVQAGSAVTVTLTPRTNLGQGIGVTGLTVVFSLTGGGTSTGTFSAVDGGSGIYTATLTGVTAGSAKTISATINGESVTSVMPTITVIPGPVSLVQSQLSIGSSVIVEDQETTITLQTKDSIGNNLTSGGLNVVFALTGGGTSSGTFGTVTDHGNGSYSASFTGDTVGSARTILATIEGDTITSVLPTVTVQTKIASAAQSAIQVSTPTFQSGTTATVTFRAKNMHGTNLVEGGDAVTLFLSGSGQSSGTFGSVTDNGDGTYTSILTGVAAGTARAIGGTINDDTVTTVLPTFTVIPGPFSLTGSTIDVNPNPVPSGSTSTITFQARDNAGNAITQAGLSLTYGLRLAPIGGGGTSTGEIGLTSYLGTGTYTTPLLGLVAGTASTLDLTVTGVSGGGNKQNALPLVTVVPGAVSLLQSTVSVDLPTIPATLATTIRLQARDSVGNAHTEGGLSVVFALSGGGSSDGTIGGVSDNDDGTYSALFTGTTVGTARTISAAIGGSPLTSPLPTITVTVGPPQITSFTADSDTAGGSVVISGENFSSTLALNAVFFGSMPAAVTAASTTSLTATVPAGAGYGPITVINLSSGLSTVSATPFQQVFDAGGYIDQTVLSSRIDVSAGSPITSVAVGDLDGDGLADVAGTSSSASTVSVYRNTGSPGSVSFAAPLVAWSGGQSQSVAFADIDGDGKLDIITQNPENAFSIAVLRNTSTPGSLSLAGAVTFNTASGTVVGVNSLAIADFNTDGKIDVASIFADAALEGTEHRAIVLQNTSTPGSLSFTFPIHLSFSAGPKGVAAGDLDGDGRPELVVTLSSTAKLIVFRNTTVAGVLGFASAQEFTTPAGPYGVTVLDINEDGKKDVLVANASGSGPVSVFRNTSSLGSVSFDAKVDFNAEFGAASVSAGDLDGDGIPDLIVANENSMSLSLFKNTTSSNSVSFSSSKNFSVGSIFAKAVPGDFDGDSKPDVALSTVTQNRFSVFRNTVGAYSPQQSLITLSEDSVQSGQSVTATLQLKNFAGADLDLPGQTVAFFLTGSGTSTGSFGSVTDNGNGSYSATFTGGIGGSPRSVGASINTTVVASTLPTITVLAGSYSLVHSTLSAPVNPPSVNVISAGDTLIITLTARDSSNNPHTFGGLDVQPFRSGPGTSNGNFVSTVDNGDGTYTIRFAGTVSGTVTDSIGVTIYGDTLTSAKILFNVQPGAISLSQSLVSVEPDTISAGVAGAGEFLLTLYDAFGNLVTAGTGTHQVQFFLMGGGSSSGLINHPDGGWAGVDGPGRYYAIISGTTAGSPTPVGAVINGQTITSAAPTITVIPGQISLSNSYIEVAHSAIGTGFTTTAILYVRDTQNNPSLGDQTVAFTITSGGGTYGAITYAGNGTYTAPLTGGEQGQKFVSAQILKNGIMQGITSFTTVQVVAALGTPSPIISGGGSGIEMSAGSYVNIPDAAPLRMTNNFTLEAWIYPTGTQNLTILDKGSYNYLFSFRPNGTTGLGFYTQQTNWIYSGGTVPTDQWSHVAVVYQEGTDGIRFYLNGNLLGTATSPASIVSNTGPVNIGRQAPGNCDCNWWQGKLDEVRIWNVARTAAEIESTYVLSLESTSGLLASYNMNEGSGITLADASGSGNTGVFGGTVSWVSSGASIQTRQPVEPTLSWGSVDEATFYQVQLSTDGGFSSLVGDTAVSATSVTFTGLNLSTAYYWRVKAMSSYNASAYSGTVSFVTVSTPPGLPDVITQAPSAITMSSAQLNGIISSNGAVTTAKFLIGTSSGVYSDTLTATQSPIAALDSIAVSATATGLTHSQTYYARLIGSNSFGDAQGDEVSFTTSAPPVIFQTAGSALSFDGSNDYVSTTLSDLGGSEITIEYWFKGSSAVSAVRQQNGGDYIVAPWSNPPIHILSNDGGTAQGISAGSSIYDGQWHHVAMTWQQNTENGFKSYLDGALVDQRTSGNTPIPNISSPVFLGSHVGSGEFMNGMMDEIRIWSVARTQQQIREHMHQAAAATDPGLVAYWQLNEGSGLTAADSIGNAHGMLVNGPTWAASSIPFGEGSSASTSGFVSGPLTLGPVAMTVTNPSAAPVDVTVTAINTAPNTTQGVLDIRTPDQYWIVEVFGTPGGFSMDLTISLSPGMIGNDDVAVPANLRLYQRSSNANGGWSLLVSASAATDSTVTFSGVTTFGQFIIGRITAPALPLGSGTLEDPYQIASLGNLLWITSDVSRWNKHYIQTAHIDASETASWNGGAGWSPIGTNATRFTGSYDGQNFIIDGLYISRGSTNDIGLFGRCSGSTITNVGLTDVSIFGSVAVGGLAGYSDMNCTVNNSSTTGNISGTQHIGGLVGFNYWSSISSSFSTANVSGSFNVGGLTAANYSNASITNSYATGTVSGGDYAAGLTSVNYNNSVVSNSFSTGAVSGGSPVGGLVTSHLSATVDSSFWDTQTSSQATSEAGTGKTTAEMKVQSTFTDAGWDFSTMWQIDPTVNNGYPSLQWQTAPSPPFATSNAVSNIGPVSATFNGSVNPRNDSTVVRFMYGTSSGTYSDSVDADQSPLAGWGDVLISMDVGGLTPGQTYYVRVAASNSQGSAYGTEVSFTTPEIPSISSLAGAALTLDGADDYVVVSSSVDFEISTGTFEVWFKPTWVAGSLGKNPGLVANRSATETRYSIHVRDNLDGLDLWNGGSTGTVNYTFQQGAWYHLAWVQSGSGSTVYVNGHLAGTTEVAFGSATGLPFTIGGTLSSEAFNGDLDEVRVWNVARSASQIRESMHKALSGTEVGLVAYWQFNEGSGTSAADSISDHHGTLVNGPTWSTSTVPFGGGSSVSITNFTSGATVIGSVEISTSDAFDAPVDLTVTEVSGMPNTADGTEGTLADRYWVIDLFGTPGSFSVDLTLYLEPGAIGAVDIASPEGLKLYRRNSNSDGVWTEVASGSSATDSSVTFAGITSFSQFTIGSASSPLPVQLTSFTATAARLNAELKWRTESEVENHGFEVERRMLGGYDTGVKQSHPSPSSPWEEVGFVGGSGTSSSPKEYSFVDRQLSPGRYAYRIKQIDQNGTFAYTTALEVVVGLAPFEFSLGQNYPNPFNPTTTIEFTLPEDGWVVLKVYDLTGREVATLVDEDRKAGLFQQEVFDASRLASGLYFARLQASGKQLVRKMVLMK